MKICHRDLKLENTMLDGSTALRLKICDFGYSKSSVFHSQPKSTVGTPAYIAPEVLSRKQYDVKVRALCDKAKEILMEESDVQDWTGLNFQEIMDEVEKI